MNNSDSKQGKFVPKLQELRQMIDQLVVNFMGNKGKETSSSNEMSISKGTWWEITYQKTNGNETFVNKGANWEIGAVPVASNDVSDLLLNLNSLKELIKEDKEVSEVHQSTMKTQ